MTLCSYCLTRPSDEMDHVHPRSQGGPDAIWNLVESCRFCNSQKGSTSLVMFLLRRRHGGLRREYKSLRPRPSPPPPMPLWAVLPRPDGLAAPDQTLVDSFDA